MVDITKTLSVCVVTRMNKKGGYTEHEKQVFEYGVELMLNSILKIFVYMIIGFFIGREKEIIVAIGLFSISGTKSKEEQILLLLMHGGDRR